MNLKNRSFLSTQDWSLDELSHILDLAEKMKRSGHGRPLSGKSLAMLFFNPSLRTRSSFELGMYQLGGHAVCLAPGKDAWPLEPRPGVVMDGEAEEHVQEAAAVLSRFFDAISIRCFPKFQDWSEDRQDRMIRAFARWATKPIINMETIVHPCQELALMLSIKEKLGLPARKNFLLTWTYHPKGLNTAVANSAALIASRFGMNVTILRPSADFDLDPMFMDQVKDNVKASGARLTVTDSIDGAYTGADFVYAKSWGAIKYFGRWEEEKKIREPLKHFIVDQKKMELTNDAYFSHCLPMRRNVKATDEVADSPRSLIHHEAENRIHVQKALLAEILG
ncbi:MAG: N-acetylornithine carbamoyltransferase [Planctomycetes bacterium]|nr:N-acetylornithine carbamoyltransferase [Planctomycetota bacterium]